MKDCYGDYIYKGWIIHFSEYRQGWYFEPTEKLITKLKLVSDIDIIECWIENFDVYNDTIKETKEYINENEEELITFLKSLA